MRQITTHNYEEFAVEYIIGELNDEQTKAFLEFVAKHPDVADELILLEKDVETEITEVPSFDNLKMSLNRVEINDTNFEEYCIAALEGDLDNATLVQLERYIGNDKKKQEVKSLYAQTVLPNVVMEYPNKKALLKPTRKALFSKRILHVGGILVAASLLAFLVMFVKPEHIYAPNGDGGLADVMPPDTSDTTPVDTIEIVDKSDVVTDTKVLVAESVPVVQKTKHRNIIQTLVGDTIINKIMNTDTVRYLASIKHKTVISPTPELKLDDMQLAMSSPKTIRIRHAEDENTLRDKATNYLLTKVVTESIENINKMAETNIGYQIINDEDGKPERVKIKSRFGEIDRFIAQR